MGLHINDGQIDDMAEIKSCCIEVNRIETWLQSDVDDSPTQFSTLPEAS